MKTFYPILNILNTNCDGRDNTQELLAAFPLRPFKKVWLGNMTLKQRERCYCDF